MYNCNYFAHETNFVLFVIKLSNPNNSWKGGSIELHEGMIFLVCTFEK